LHDTEVDRRPGRDLIEAGLSEAAGGLALWGLWRWRGDEAPGEGLPRAICFAAVALGDGGEGVGVAIILTNPTARGATGRLNLLRPVAVAARQRAGATGDRSRALWP
jgi:hypothetical protein